MAEANCFWKIKETVLGIGDHLVAPIQRQFKYMCCFDSNIKELESQLEMLQSTKQGVQMRVDNDRADVRIINPNVEAWLRSANEVTSEVEVITQEKPKVKEGCFNGWCPNLKLRYSLSRKAVKNTEVAVKLQAAAVSYTQTSYSLAPTSMETIPNEHFTWFESQKLTMEKIIAALKQDEINLIGICGLGGTGKTTMVLEVAKRAKEVYHFEEVAMAIVSQEPNLTNVQACIADMLGLKLGDRDSPIIRAALLHKRLLQDNKKVLVILDDIWEEFDLRDMGIPFEGANKNFKMLYTSRTRDLWHDVQTKMEISLEVLSENEAWQLFREKAGKSADAQELQSITKQIVYRCGHLPLALVHIGSALSKKSGRNAIKDRWEGMLHRLTCARDTSADHQLSHLELTYIVLEDMEAQRLFLLCCLFQEDEDIYIEDLARYGFGQSLFVGINEMAKVRSRVFDVVDDLKSRYLLLDSEKKECVKVHKVVRDMGISIASKDNNAIVSHGAVYEWPKTVTHEHYIAISVISEKIKEFPEGLTYPNLEFLMLRCHELEKLPPNFFKGMGNLKVLELKNLHGILTFQPLKNLTTLALEGFCMLDNVHVIGDLRHLEILNFRDSGIKELPEQIRELVKLRLLDVRGTTSLERIPPNVVSCLVQLEELYVIPSRFCYWEGEGEEKGSNANLKELESLSYLNTLEIMIKKHVVVPKLPILGKLKKYKVIQVDLYEAFKSKIGNPYKRQLMISEWNWDTPAGRGGIDTLLRSSDCLILTKGSIEVVFELEGVDSNEPNPELLSSLKVVELRDLPKLNYISKRDPMGFKYTQMLEIYGCDCLTYVFAPTVTNTIPQLRVLKIQRCKMLSRIVAEKNGLGESSVDEVEFPRLERLELIGLPKLTTFCSSTHPLELPLLTKISISFCPSMDAFSLGQVTAPNLSSSGILWNGNLINAIQRLQENGDDPMATSMEKPSTFDYFTDKSKFWQVAETPCWLVAMTEGIDETHKVARLLYTNSGNGVLALGCNGSMRLWKCGSSKHNPSGKATTSVVPQLWQPASGLAMTNDLTGAKLEEVVPCIALSKNDSYVISAYGGVISLFNMMTFEVMTTFMPHPPASTFLAFYPQDNNIIAIGMEDSTIHIYNVSMDKVKSTLKGHQKRITGLAFSTNLNILVSSGVDAQICIWSTDTWKKLKPVPIELPAGKASNGDTRVQFHSNQIDLLVSHETQLAIYDASNMKFNRICQWVSQDVLPAPISCATYACDSQLVYVSFCDGNVGVFDADSLTLLCRIAQSEYLSPALLSGGKAVYPLVIAAHPQLRNQFAIGLTDGLVIVIEMEPPTITGLDGGTTSSSNANDQTPDQIHSELKTREEKKNEMAVEHPMKIDSSFNNSSIQMNGSTDHINSDFTLNRGSPSGSGSREAGNSGLRGLDNLGNTCFMNSAIQCLVHTSELVDHFKDYQKDINTEESSGMKGELAFQFGDLLRKLRAPEAGPVSPEEFNSKLAAIDPRFNDGNQHDSQEFLAFLLNELHEDLNCATCKPIEAIDVEGRPDEAESNKQWLNHLSCNTSIIVDLFHGQYQSKLVCLVCEKKSSTFERFQDLSLPIPLTKSGTITLDQCLQTYLQDEFLGPEDKWNCPHCKTHQQANKKLDLWRLPEILSIHLKRFSNKKKKLETFVDFPIDDFDLSGIVRNSQQSHHYILYAVINHYGDMGGGHYTAYVKHGGDQWYKFDDSRVSPVAERQIKSSAAYVLFYRRKADV